MQRQHLGEVGTLMMYCC